jgi:hypothetical protein
MIEEEKQKSMYDDGKTKVVGLGDVRKALKQNLVEVAHF